MREDAKVCAETLAAVRPEQRLEDTGFTKVTVTINNPIPVHTDRGNLGQTFLMRYDAGQVGERELIGASHVILHSSMRRAMVVRDRKEGIFIVAPYHSVLRANLATQRGERLI
eukprot:2937135-Pleurochrysis_carterae.AAC.1